MNTYTFTDTVKTYTVSAADETQAKQKIANRTGVEPFTLSLAVQRSTHKEGFKAKS